MLARYRLKAVEYIFYALALLAFLPLLRPETSQISAPDHVAGIVFILIGVGVLLPRAVAYTRWPKVLATVGTYSGTWDGEQKASYRYKVGQQSFEGSFRSMYGTAKLTRLIVCANPDAPWVRYLVIWNVWVFGAVMLAAGLFLLLSGQNYLG